MKKIEKIYSNINSKNFHKIIKLRKFVIMSDRVYLTEQEKIKIISMVYVYGHRWKFSSETIGHPYETVRNFYKSYLEHDTIFPKQGRPIKIDDNEKTNIVNHFRNTATGTLRNASTNFDLSPSSIRKVLNENKIQFFQKILVCPLKQTHFNNRVNFFGNMINAPQQNIIFTDESTVEVDLGGHGIWRRRGLYPLGTFYEKPPHPTHVMVWGGDWVQRISGPPNKI